MSYRSDRSRPRLLTTALLACFVLCIALACKKKQQPSPSTVARAAELKPKVTQRLAQVASLTAKLKSTESLTVTNSELAQKLNSLTFVVIGEAYLAKPNESQSSDKLDLSDPVLSTCKYIVDREQVNNDDIESLERCDRLEYVGVIRERDFTPPDANESSQTYSPGSFSGDVLVFHLPTSELRGNHSISVSQDDTLKMKAKQKPQAHEWRQQATAYLRSHVREAAEKELQKARP